MVCSSMSAIAPIVVFSTADTHFIFAYFSSFLRLEIFA